VYSNLNVVNKVNNALILPNEIYLKSKNIISQQFVPLIMIDIVFGSLISEDKAADSTFKKTFGYIEENE
ncbi:hypothetical protein, partial [Alkalibacterium sp. 20]|uniref:hypothetical protein n=1 Tax=Alkalibacterium sp. 20 TaxID=1798803 RepID=UPI000A9FC8A8